MLPNSNKLSVCEAQAKCLKHWTYFSSSSSSSLDFSTGLLWPSVSNLCLVTWKHVWAQALLELIKQRLTLHYQPHCCSTDVHHSWVKGYVRNHTACLSSLNVKLLFLKDTMTFSKQTYILAKRAPAKIFAFYYYVGVVTSHWQGNNVINGSQIELKRGFDRGFPQCHGLTYRFLYLPPTHTHRHTNKSLCREWRPSISTNNQIILQESFTSLSLSSANGERDGDRERQAHAHSHCTQSIQFTVFILK